MSANQNRPNPDIRQPEKPKIKDLPGCIKYIILLFLLFLLFWEFYAGEYRGFPKVSQTVLIIILLKILLIILLIILIWVQRHLICEITSPIGCVTNALEYDPATGRWFIRVIGTARGTAFGSYTVSTTPAIPVIYPGGGSSGTVSVDNDELARLDVNIIPPGPHTITLVVTPSGAGPTCIDTDSFDWADRTTGINAIGGVEARWVGGVKRITGPANLTLPPDPAVSIGGGPSVTGTADFTGCGREMIEYELQHKIVNAGESPWPALDLGPWANILPLLQFGDSAHPRTFLHLDGSPPSPTTHYNSVRSRGNLTRVWADGPFLMPPPPPPETFAPRPYTADSAWGTSTNLPDPLNGQYTVRLRVRHAAPSGPPAPADIYDTATVWIDNRTIEGQITGIAVGAGSAFSACEELSLSQFVTPGSPSATSTPADIRGRAWDPVILDSYVVVPPLPALPHTFRPNDNFGSFTLEFKKDGATSFAPIPAAGGGTTRVPDILRVAELTPLVLPLPPVPPHTGSLALWNIVKALDAGPRIPPTPGVPGSGSPAVAPGHKIYRGERCAYLIVLGVSDTTRIGDSASTHTIRHDWPFCIMNDIPDDVVPNATSTPWP